MEIALDINDKNSVDTIWEQLKSLKPEMRKALASRLVESFKTKTGAADTAGARKFIESLSVTNGDEVPSNENGLYAMLEENISTND